MRSCRAVPGPFVLANDDCVSGSLRRRRPAAAVHGDAGAFDTPLPVNLDDQVLVDAGIGEMGQRARHPVVAVQIAAAAPRVVVDLLQEDRAVPMPPVFAGPPLLVLLLEG